jgi:hypothetical protein
MTTDPKEPQKHHRSEDIALFRYGLIREAVDEAVSKSKRVLRDSQADHAGDIVTDHVL